MPAAITVCNINIMPVNMTVLGAGSEANNSTACNNNMTSWDQTMDHLYTYFYLFLFIPGLLLNTTALWVLCRHISKKTKAVIFMINLAVADLAHVLSLPLRIYYYFTHTWPFGHAICMLCFYLKYLNMYASIGFLVCISVQRCLFLLHPFSARRWRRRYDLCISIVMWVVVSLGCSPFILIRNSSSPSLVPTLSPHHFTQSHLATAQIYASLLPTSPSSVALSSIRLQKNGCFKDLPTRRLPISLAVTIAALAELFGFVLPLVTIGYSSIRIFNSLHLRAQQEDPGERHQASATLSPSARRRVMSASSSYKLVMEKRRGLRMALSCSALFLFCFAPYHLNFLLYIMVSQGIVSHCGTKLAVLQFHPVSLCLASLSCCLNPLLYYFLTAEFRLHLSIHTSINNSLISSPNTSSFHRPQQRRERLMSMESTSSFRG